MKRHDWEIQVEKTARQLESQLKGLGVPVVVGSLSGGTQVYLAQPDFERYRELVTPGSMAVVDCYVEDDVGLAVHVRLGTTDTWLTFELSSVDRAPVLSEPMLRNGKWPFPTGNTRLTEDDDGDDDGKGDENRGRKPYRREPDGDPWFPTLQKARIRELGVQGALLLGFGALRSRYDRAEYLMERAHQLDFQSDEKPNEWDFKEIADAANQAFKNGVLPLRAQRLKAEGVSTSEIAARLDTSPQRARRALHVSVDPSLAAKLRAWI